MNDEPLNKAKSQDRGRAVGSSGQMVMNDDRIEQNGSRDGKAELAARLAARRPANSGNNLYVPKDLIEDGYYYRWIKGDPARVMQLVDGPQYAHVMTSDGTKFSSNTKGVVHYLMKLPKEFRDYDDDLKRKKARAMMEGQSALKANEYSPTNHSTAISYSESTDPDAY